MAAPDHNAETLFVLSRRFEHFAEMFGVDHSNTTINLFDSIIEDITVPEGDRLVCLAWIVWTLCFDPSSLTLVWLHHPKQENSPADDVLPLLKSISHMRPHILRESRQRIVMANGSRLLCLPTTSTFRGTAGSRLSPTIQAAAHMVIEGDDLVPIDRHARPAGRVILIQKSY